MDYQNVHHTASKQELSQFALIILGIYALIESIPLISGTINVFGFPGLYRGLLFIGGGYISNLWCRIADRIKYEANKLSDTIESYRAAPYIGWI